MKTSREIALMILDYIYIDIEKLIDLYVENSYYIIVGYGDKDRIKENKLIRESANINKIAVDMVLKGNY